MGHACKCFCGVGEKSVSWPSLEYRTYVPVPCSRATTGTRREEKKETPQDEWTNQVGWEWDGHHDKPVQARPVSPVLVSIARPSAAFDCALAPDLLLLLGTPCISLPDISCPVLSSVLSGPSPASLSLTRASGGAGLFSAMLQMHGEGEGERERK